jgi:predicted porin
MLLYSDSAAVDGACVPAAGTSVTALTSKTATCTGGTIVRAYASAVSALDSRTRISAQYDLGVVKFGLGYQVKSYVTSTVKDNKQTIIGVSAPLGAFTVGATSTSNKTDDAATKTTGNEFGVNYALSKRTSVAVARTSWKVTGAAADSYTRVRLMHSF